MAMYITEDELRSRLEKAYRHGWQAAMNSLSPLMSVLGDQTAKVESSLAKLGEILSAP